MDKMAAPKPMLKKGKTNHKIAGQMMISGKYLYNKVIV